VHFFFSLQDVGLLVDHVFKEISHDECRALVLVARCTEFVLQGVVFLLQGFILCFLLLQVRLVRLQLRLEEVDHFFAGFDFVMHRKLLCITMAHSLACTECIVAMFSSAEA